MNSNNPTPAPEKVCPLQMISPKGGMWQCLGEKCAWYVPPINPRQEGRCAVHSLSMLPYVAKAVSEL